MEITLKNLLDWIIKGIVFILIISILFGAGVFVYTKYFVSPTYSATVKFYASGKETSVSAWDTYQSIAWQYIEFLNVNEFCEMVSQDLAENAGEEISPKAIAGCVSYSSVVSETSTFYAEIVTNDPTLTYNIALSVSKMAPERISGFGEVGALEVIQSPEMPVAPSGPQVMRNTVIGFLMGAFLSAALVVLKELMDNRIRTAEEITEIFKLPVFGVVPDFSVGEKKGGR